MRPGRPTGRGADQVVRLSSPHPRDLYHWLLTTSRGRFGALLVGAYLGLNGLFALAYMACGDGIENARPGSFGDAFFFSVQTMATIGYGRMVPISVLANILVTAEAGVGLFGVAVAAALMFARFTRPSAGVRFSQSAVVTQLDGKPTLMFRLANERTDLIHEARVHVVLLRDEVTDEGHSYRRLHDMALIRSFTPVFGLSWTVMHVIDQGSPLFGQDQDSWERRQAVINVLFSGHHDGFQAEVHARHAYGPEDVAWNARFADLFRTLADGRRALDYSTFDDVVLEPEGGAVSSPPPSGGP